MKRLPFCLSVSVLLFLLSATTASAAVSKVICVPWQGNTAKYHTALSGQAAHLKCVVKTTNASQIWYKWIFGDGTESAIFTLSGSLKYFIETSHTYTAATGTPFTAKLQVADNNAMATPIEDPYLLKIEDNTTDAQINISIDKGLWWLYKEGNNLGGYAPYPHTYDGSPYTVWLQTAYVYTLATPTASAIHAFGVNNHKVTGNPDEDPYVEAVRNGMNYLVKGYNYYTSYPALSAFAIGSLNRGGNPPVIDNPDGNANGYGVEVYDWGRDHTPYQGGQIMDAIIASGVLPTDLTGRDFRRQDADVLSPGTHNWTYGELIQDMTDMHAWGQYDGGGCTGGGICGSWWYGWNYGFPGDNSASQWAAIGMIPAQQQPWNAVVPQWVKTYNANWLSYSSCTSGPSHRFFSYNAPCGCAGDSCFQTTTSGMVQMVFAEQTTADAKWAPSQLYLADNWQRFLHGGSTWGGYMTYGWYSFAKAMRLSLPTATTHIVKSGTSFDWYYGDPSTTACTNESNCRKGMAPRILETQSANGSWQSGNLTNPPLTTAWMIITLKPTLFTASPIACFTATPNPSFADMPLSFDPSCSGHSEAGKTIANLTNFEWDWNNDGTYDESTPSPAVASHSFSCAVLPCIYPVKLRVTDDNIPAGTATAIVNVNITNPPHPPVANAGGPYLVSTCSADTLALDGSKSFDQDEGTHQAGCTTCPDDTITAWQWDLVPPLTFDAINKSGKLVTLSSADIAFYLAGAGMHNLGLRVTDNTALAYPGSGQGNLTNSAFGTVDVKNGCLCNLAARPKSGKVQLTWTHVPGATYDIYRSTEGPNTGFAKIASGHVTTYATYLDSNVVNGTKYYYRVVTSGGCMSKSASATPTAL